MTTVHYVEGEVTGYLNYKGTQLEVHGTIVANYAQFLAEILFDIGLTETLTYAINRDVYRVY